MLPWAIAGACALALGAVLLWSRPFSTKSVGSTVAPSLGASGEPLPAAPDASAVSPSASASSAGQGEIDGLDAAHWRGALHQAADAKEWHRGAAAVLALAELDPAAFGEPDIVVEAAGAAIGIELGDHAVAERVYETLSHKLGARGVDVLYEMISRYGGSRGARRAAELLRRPEVAAQATPAARIALALRDTPCERKVDLYDRAAKEGDERTLALLWAMRSPQCAPRTGECCVRNDPRLEDTVKDLRARLKR